MIRNLKVLGLALVAMLTMGVASASAASFHSETSPTALTGSQTTPNTFTTHTGTVHCSSATFTGETKVNTPATIDVTPIYSGCVNTGLAVNVTVDHNGCEYRLSPNGHVAIVGCNAGTSGIVVTAPFCTITVTAAQNQTLNKVEYVNTGAGATREVDVIAKVTNIAYHESGFACDNPSGSNTTGGKYEGTVRVTGENPISKAHHGVWWTA